MKTLECQYALGMESGNISDGQISASSEWNTTHYADQCRVATTYYANHVNRTETLMTSIVYHLIY